MKPKTRAIRTMFPTDCRRLLRSAVLAMLVAGCASAQEGGRGYNEPGALPRTAPPAGGDAASRAQSLFAQGDPAGAVRELVAREAQLASPAELARNRDLIWDGLASAELHRQVIDRARGFGAEVAGWVELAAIWKQDGGNVPLEDWRRRYPGHPGAERLGMLAQPGPDAAGPGWAAAPGYDASRSGGIALLLPLTGTMAASAEAVRDGFLSAYFAAGGSQSVRVHDVGSTREAAIAAYQQALQEGAAFVVGPLQKEGVAAIAGLGQPPAPVMALNYLDDPARAPFNFFQFGLAPEDEARAAAEHAVAEGLRRAVMLTPSSDWGERIAAAFQQRLQELGGQLVEGARYTQGDRDYSSAIQRLMNTDASMARHQMLVATLGMKSEFEVRRRADIDFIFFTARAQDARLIWPQFRFHRASGLPVYATAQVHDGGDEPELDGVRVCDMPWMLGGYPSLDVARRQAEGLAGARRHPRLFAFGFDAHTLVQRIMSGPMRPGDAIDGGTGSLRVSAAGVVARGMACVPIQSQGPRPPPATSPVPAPAP